MWVDPKDFMELQKTVNSLNEELKRLYNRTCLVDVKKNGENVTMTFTQGNRTFTVEAVRIISGGEEFNQLS